VRFNVSLGTLQVISATVLQAITCTGTDNKNKQQNQGRKERGGEMKGMEGGEGVGAPPT